MLNNDYIEIERKFLVRSLPQNLEDFPHKQISQSYLSTPGTFPVMRVRRYGDEYLLTIKKRVEESLSCHEVEFPIEPEIFAQLKIMAEGRDIEKTRYRIPWENKTVELDIFSGRLNGLIMAEIEYSSLEEATLIPIPDWFGEEVTQDRRYSNNHLSEYGLPS
jgi:adenylate cyclase